MTLWHLEGILGNAVWSEGWVLLHQSRIALKGAPGKVRRDPEGNLWTSFREVIPPPGRISLLLFAELEPSSPALAHPDLGQNDPRCLLQVDPELSFIFWSSLESGRPLYKPSKCASSDYIPLSWKKNELLSALLFQRHLYMGFPESSSQPHTSSRDLTAICSGSSGRPPGTCDLIQKNKGLCRYN